MGTMELAIEKVHVYCGFVKSIVHLKQRMKFWFIILRRDLYVTVHIAAASYNSFLESNRNKTSVSTSTNAMKVL